jgi:hypothetical protein
MKKNILTFIIGCFVIQAYAQSISNGKINDIIKDLNSLNIYRTKDYDLNIAEKSFFYAEKASSPIDVFDFQTGSNKIYKINKNDNFIVVAQTRFIVKENDKKWTHFYVVKCLDNMNRFWDGIISLDSINTKFDKLLFLNCQFHYNNQTIATVEGENQKQTVIYIFDNTLGKIYKTDGIAELVALKFNKINDREFKYIQYIYNGEKPDTYDKYQFSIISDELNFGNILWDYKNEKVTINVTDPIDIYTGKKYKQK